MSQGYSYFAFLYGKTQQLVGDFKHNGIELAKQCIDGLDKLDKDQFPPRLLILLTPPGLTKSAANGLLAGINESFEKYHTKAVYEKVPLIGGSTAAVFFDGNVHSQGALLICLASRLLEKVEVEVADRVSKNSKNKIDKLLARLKLREKGEDVDPFANRMLFTFFPGFRDEQYLAAELHEHLRQNRQSLVPIFGGGTHGGDRKKPGWQFANGKIYEDAVVAAQITSGTPISLSLSHGLTPTDHILQVSGGNGKGTKIEFFGEKRASDVIDELHRENKGFVLLERIFRDADGASVVENPRIKGGSEARFIEMLRAVREGQAFRVVYPKSGEIQKAIIEEIRSSKERIRLEYPIACLSFKCAGHFSNKEKILPDFKREFANIEKENKAPYLGAFFDGEAGMDRHGRSALSNWSTATMVFGDELRDRTPFYRSLKELAVLNLKETDRHSTISITEKARMIGSEVLDLLYGIGFPGATLSFVLRNDGEEAGEKLNERIVVRRTKGQVPWSVNHYFSTHSWEETARQRAKANQMLSPPKLYREGKSLLCAIPLMTLEKDIGAFLHINLGVKASKRNLSKTEKELMGALGNIVYSILARVYNWSEINIIERLDQILTYSLSEKTVEAGLKRFLTEAAAELNIKDWHTRLEKNGELELITGNGRYYQAALKLRPVVTPSTDNSPATMAFKTRSNDGLNCTVINVASESSAHKQMQEKNKDNPDWQKGTSNVGSYINVAFSSERGEAGTIVLISSEEWFFKRYHIPVCKALGKRVGILIDHLQQKTRQNLDTAKLILAAAVDHELWGNIGNLNTFPVRLRQSFSESSHEACVEDLTNVIENCDARIKRIRKVIEQISELDFSATDLNELIKSAVNEVRREQDLSKIKLEYRLAPNLEVNIDNKLMKTAFLNLVENSIKFMKVRDEQFPRQLTISTSLEESGDVKICFEDTGIGMSEEMQEAIYQFINGREERGIGGRIGLLIVRTVLDLHNGRFYQVQSESGRGTAVTIIFPAQ